MTDPNRTNHPNQNAGGATKIKPTSQDGEAYAGHSGYGFMINGVLQDPPTGAHTMPKASPIPIMTYGDPGNTAFGEPSK